MNAPSATVRLQLHAGFTLHDACMRVPYYASMGVSHFYLSPVFCSVPGSMHGYDVTDPACINPQLGGEPALRELSQALRAQGMGIVLDIVPNHMATHACNPWWWDVLKRGMQSRYATWFDIDWRPADKSLHGKVLAPFLADDYAASLARGDLRLIHDQSAGRYVIQACGAVYPVAPGTLAERGHNIAVILSDYDPMTQAGQLRLHELLKRQYYRLCSWSSAADSLNWRRFFEITGLIGLRVEEPDVFDAVHSLPLRLYEEGLVDGLRVDHVDGLARPLEYCKNLRRAMQQRRPQISQPWVVVEKILAHGETLDERWQVSGTTGYDFMDQVAAVLHDAQGLARLAKLWATCTGHSETAEEHVRQARLTMLRRHFVAERLALVRRMHRLITANADPSLDADPDLNANPIQSPNFNPNLNASPSPSSNIGVGAISLLDVDRTLEAFLAEFPVYRTYIQGGKAFPQDAAVIHATVAAAGARLAEQGEDAHLLSRMTAWLLEFPSNRQADHDHDQDQDQDQGYGDRDRRECERGISAAQNIEACRKEVIRRFEQLTPPLAAKSLEDTVFYRYGPLLSRNEVGSEPDSPSLGVQGFYDRNMDRARRFPDSLLATASHDHKRGEDARARLAVLSERVDAWQQACATWSAWRQPLPSHTWQPAERYMLWQTLVGAWPLDLDINDAATVGRFARRIVQWQGKALREAKNSSSWFAPNLEYEHDSAQYVYELLGWPASRAALLARPEVEMEANTFTGHDASLGLLRSFDEFVQGIAPAGVVNSLAQTVLRLTVPGIPDLYQGTERWDFSLVDPDNRRPVDYTLREHALKHIDAQANLPALLQHWRDGGIKQAVVRRLLQLRLAMPDVFRHGVYQPLEVRGSNRDHLIAFERRHGGKRVLVVVPRLCAAAIVMAGSGPCIDMTCWKDTGIMVTAPGRSSLADIFTGKAHNVSQDAMLGAGQLLAELPFAVLAAA